MPNIFQRFVSRITGREAAPATPEPRQEPAVREERSTLRNRVARLNPFQRARQEPRQAEERAPEPRQEPKGLLDRLPVVGRRREEERQEVACQVEEVERQRQLEERERSIAERERQLEERSRQAEEQRQREEVERRADLARQVEERERLLEERERAIAERSRQVEEKERELEERTEPRRPVVKPEEPEQERQREERQATPQPRQEPTTFEGIPPFLALGPKGRDGAAYTSSSSEDIMGRLEEAAALGNRVSLRVHDENGWHDLFLNDVSGPGRHKPGKGISADYLLGAISDYGDFGDWVEDGADTGDGGYEDELGTADGYQLTVWS